MKTGAIGKGMSIDARGKFGYSGAFGRIAFGYTRFGFYSWYAGIYSKKHGLNGTYISRMKFYRPTNSQTIPQQNWRAVCAYGVYLWQNLSAEIKENYNLRAVKLKMSGYNLFLREWLKPATGGFGRIIFSHNIFGNYQ